MNGTVAFGSGIGHIYGKTQSEVGQRSYRNLRPAGRTRATYGKLSYLNGKPDDFDGIEAKRFLLSQAGEQVSWYRQSIEALDYVGCIACRRALEAGQGFLEHYLPAYNVRDTERGTEFLRDTAFPLLPKMWTRFEEGYLDAGEAGDDAILDLR